MGRLAAGPFGNQREVQLRSRFVEPAVFAPHPNHAYSSGPTRTKSCARSMISLQIVLIGRRRGIGWNMARTGRIKA